MSGGRRRARLSHERRVLLMAIASGLPAVVVALALLWTGDATPKVVWTLSTLVLICWLGFSFALRSRVVYPLQTLSNLLAGLREGDASIRARGAGPDDALGEVMLEANVLAETLRAQRLGALEATALLRKVMEEIDVAVFTFDAGHRLRLVNRAGERLLGRAAERLLASTAEGLGLASCLEASAPRVVEPGPAVRLPGDSDQMEQLLINLVHNAVDAALETAGGVRIGWATSAGSLELIVDDDGPGLAQTANLFVPFFTTKPGGSGIGLVLCRQIAEGHNGTLSLANRLDRSGCRAVLRLPMTARRVPPAQ